MKIYEILAENKKQKITDDFDPLEKDQELAAFDDLETEDDLEPLETEAGDSVEEALISAVRQLIKDGASEVETDMLKNKVMDVTGEPFKTSDLVALFKQSDELQRYIDRVDPKKVKFSTAILTAQSDNKSGKDTSTETISRMAERAASRRA